MQPEIIVAGIFALPVIGAAAIAIREWVKNKRRTRRVEAAALRIRRAGGYRNAWPNPPDVRAGVDRGDGSFEMMTFPGGVCEEVTVTGTLVDGWHWANLHDGTSGTCKPEFSVRACPQCHELNPGVAGAKFCRRCGTRR